MSKDKTRNGGKWTESRWRSFVISALRAATGKWSPKQQAKRDAKVRYGVYKCACCGEEGPPTAWREYKSGDKKGQPKKVNNAVVDHIDPVVDPYLGFTTWDDYVERMFCEVDNFQVICHDCHEQKCAEERKIRNANR